jgi:hypothetical protein
MDRPGFSSLYTRKPLTMAMIIAFVFALALMLGLAVTNPSWGSRMTHSVRALLSHNGAVPGSPPQVDGDYVQRLAEIDPSQGW